MEKGGVEYVLFWFTDIEGHLKSFAITPSEIEGALNDGMGFDGSSITGFNAIEESDMVAIPDPIALMVGLMRARGERPAALWLGGRPVLREVLTGLTYVPVVFLLGSSLLLTMRALTPQMHNVNVNPFEALAGNSLQDAALLGLVAIVAGGVREELQRAFLLDRFAYLGPPWAGVVLLSAAFGLGHLLGARRRGRHRGNGRVLGAD